MRKKIIFGILLHVVRKMESIMCDSAITCDEIIDADREAKSNDKAKLNDEETKTIPNKF